MGARVEREKLCRFPCALDPINVFAATLLQERCDTSADVTNPPAVFL